MTCGGGQSFMADEETEPDFDRFKELTRQLLTVPKSQLDKEIQAEKAKGPQVKTNGPEAKP